jgi:hypothetical protein
MPLSQHGISGSTRMGATPIGPMPWGKPPSRGRQGDRAKGRQLLHVRYSALARARFEANFALAEPVSARIENRRIGGWVACRGTNWATLLSRLAGRIDPNASGDGRGQDLAVARYA